MRQNRNKIILIVFLCVYLFTASCGAVTGESLSALVEDITALFAQNQTTQYSYNPDTGQSTVLLNLDTDCMYDVYKDSGTAMTFSEYITTPEAITAHNKIKADIDKLVGQLSVMGIEVQNTYSILYAGVSAKVYLSDLPAVQKATLTQIALSVDYKIDNLFSSDTTLEQLTASAQSDYADHNNGINKNESKYKGENTLIAVLDTGIDYCHPAFSYIPHSSNQKINLSDIQSVWDQTEARDILKQNRENLDPNRVYKNGKIPFAFDYANRDADVYPTHFHGNHVAGIIGGKSDIITGSAYECQLAVMKVCRDNTTAAETPTLMLALEDCFLLGVDVINMSLGADCGLSMEYADNTINEAYKKLYDAGIIVCAASGNSFYSAYDSALGQTSSLYPTNGVVCSSGSYYQTLCIASLNSTKSFYMSAGEKDIYIIADSYVYGESYTESVINSLLGTNTSKSFDYVKIGEGGVSSAYQNKNVSGKIAVVEGSDEISYRDKQQNAANAGAVACIIYNSSYHALGEYLDANVLPSFFISKDDVSLLSDTGSLSFSKDNATYIMSEFSSWGPNEDLLIKPELTSYGGSVYSAVLNGEYGSYSGTSMATPNAAAACAIVKQYMSGLPYYADYSDFDLAVAVKNKLMSTADIVYNINGNIASVRSQGAGNTNIEKACYCHANLTSFYTGQAKIELGDDKNKTGRFTLDALLTNDNGGVSTYTVSAITAAARISADSLVMTNNLINLDCSVRVLVDGKETNTVTTTAPSHRIRVKISLSQQAKDYLNQYQKGTYVEGFLVLSNNDETLSLPWLSFYGDWASVPSFDTSSLVNEDIKMGNFRLKSIYKGYKDYSQGIYSLGAYEKNGTPNFDFCALSIDTSGVTNYGMKSINSVEIPLLRTTPNLKFYVISEDGQVIWEKALGKKEKQYYNSNNKKTNTIELIDIGFNTYNTYKIGNSYSQLTAGEYYTFTVSTALEYGKVTDANKISVNIYIDGRSPQYNTSKFSISRENGKTYLNMSVFDDHYLSVVKVYAASKSGETFTVGALKGTFPVSGFVSNQFNDLTFDITDSVKDYSGEYISVYMADCALNYSAVAVSLGGI